MHSWFTVDFKIHIFNLTALKEGFISILFANSGAGYKISPLELITNFIFSKEYVKFLSGTVNPDIHYPCVFTHRQECLVLMVEKG